MGVPCGARSLHSPAARCGMTINRLRRMSRTLEVTIRRMIDYLVKVG